MLNRIIAILVVLMSGSVTAAERTAQITSIDAAASALARFSSTEVREFSTRDFGRERYSAGRSVVVPEDKANEILNKVRPLLGKGLVAYLGASRSYAKGAPEGTEVVIAPGADQFDVLRVAATDALNYGKTTEDIIAQLRVWDRAYGIDVFRAETDVVEFRVRRPPANWLSFAKQIYKFCPDIVDQGAGTVGALEAEIRQTGRVYLWWD